ncbi:unnamed protein product [Bemisia tabaci]|uniref:Uncharacterized protein n=1 Tax=Bemisia tabaci TaxID=7038 RepID=A0A9P0ACH4_BEMTA|nr:unnamed protein product [Bemisia tabaci]
MDSPPELSTDLLESQEYFRQYFETAELRWQQLKECEVKIGRLEDEIRTFEQRENDWKERNEQSQALILTQLEHINELTQDSSLNGRSIDKSQKPAAPLDDCRYRFSRWMAFAQIMQNGGNWHQFNIFDNPAQTPLKRPPPPTGFPPFEPMLNNRCLSEHLAPPKIDTFL